MHLTFEEATSPAALCEPSWSLKTAPKQWSPDNPANGQCNVTAAVVHDLFGGEISAHANARCVCTITISLTARRADLSDSQFTDPGARFAAPDPYEDQPTTREAALEGIPGGGVQSNARLHCSQNWTSTKAVATVGRSVTG